VPVTSIDYPGLQPSKQPAKMKLLADLAGSEKELEELPMTSIPSFHISQTRTRHLRSTRARNKCVSLCLHHADPMFLGINALSQPNNMRGY